MPGQSKLIHAHARIWLVNCSPYPSDTVIHSLSLSLLIWLLIGATFITDSLSWTTFSPSHPGDSHTHTQPKLFAVHQLTSLPASSCLFPLRHPFPISLSLSLDPDFVLISLTCSLLIMHTRWDPHTHVLSIYPPDSVTLYLLYNSSFFGRDVFLPFIFPSHRLGHTFPPSLWMVTSWFFPSSLMHGKPYSSIPLLLFPCVG